MRKIGKAGILALILAVSATGAVEAKNNETRSTEQIRIVGSSTVYPFVTLVSEEFGKKSGFKTPIVESTGTGGGMKLFCQGDGVDTPDMVNASRRMKPQELLECRKNGVNDITEVKIGYDGIVFANSKEAPRFDVSIKDLFLAMAAKVPSKEDPKKLVDNFYTSWYDINCALPKQNIEIYGPPPTSGTRDSIAELVMDGACLNMDAFKNAYPDESERKNACKKMREDGKYIEAGENDNLIVQKLIKNKKAIGIFGYSFLEENKGNIQGSRISQVEPNHGSISDGTYIVSRPLFVYVKNSHKASIPGIKEFIAELVSDDAAGGDGYLEAHGLIPLNGKGLAEVRKNVDAGSKLDNLAEEAAPVKALLKHSEPECKEEKKPVKK